MTTDNSDLLCVFDELYDSEINFTVHTFWDGGFTAKLGDESNGFKGEGYGESMADVALWLKDAAIACFPESDFAKRYT